MRRVSYSVLKRFVKGLLFVFFNKRHTVKMVYKGQEVGLLGEGSSKTNFVEYESSHSPPKHASRCC